MKAAWWSIQALKTSSPGLSSTAQTLPKERTVISPPFSSEVTASAPSSNKADTIKIRAIRRIRTVMAGRLSRAHGPNKFGPSTTFVTRSVLARETAAHIKQHIDIGIDAGILARAGADLEQHSVGFGTIDQMMAVLVTGGKTGTVARLHDRFT